MRSPVYNLIFEYILVVRSFIKARINNFNSKGKFVFLRKLFQKTLKIYLHLSSLYMIAFLLSLRGGDNSPSPSCLQMCL